MDRDAWVQPEWVIDPWKVPHPTESPGHSRNVVPASLTIVVDVVMTVRTTGGISVAAGWLPSSLSQAKAARPTDADITSTRIPLDDGSQVRRS